MKKNKHIWLYDFLIQRNCGDFYRLKVYTDEGKNSALRQLERDIVWLKDNTPSYRHPTGFFIFEGRTLDQRRYWK